MAITQPLRRDAQIEFTGRVPFAFDSTEGQEATLHVPSQHRFVIEHVDVSCWAKNEHVEVQLVTQSRHMFRHMSLTCRPERLSLADNVEPRTALPILVQQSTANTLLFSNQAVRSSSTVPPDTYVQVWGYLEPTNEGRVLKQGLGIGVSGLPTDVVPGEEQ